MNYFIPGRIVNRFSSRSNKEIVIRYPNWTDLESLTAYLNSISEEDTFVYYAKRFISKEAVIGHLENIFKDIELGNKLYLVAEYEEKIIGNCHIDIDTGKETRGIHVGKLGISINHAYRQEGIGTALFEQVRHELPDMMPSIKILMLEVFESNIIAQNLYKKIGFIETGRIPKGILYNNIYMDEIIMCMTLEKSMHLQI